MPSGGDEHLYGQAPGLDDAVSLCLDFHALLRGRTARRKESIRTLHLDDTDATDVAVTRILPVQRVGMSMSAALAASTMVSPGVKKTFRPFIYKLDSMYPPYSNTPSAIL